MDILRGLRVFQSSSDDRLDRALEATYAVTDYWI